MLLLKRMSALILAVLLLLGQALADETVLVDEEGGHWRYENEGLTIEINRREDKDAVLVWYEAELWCSPENPLFTVLTNVERPGRSFQSPETISRKNKLVFAISDDFFGFRTYNNKTIGVVIRQGQLVSAKTNKKSGTQVPNLDTMAFYPDGSAKVHACNEVTAEEYVAEGAVNVLAFGPILIRDGEINPLLSEAFKAREPRVGIGMIEPHHYAVVLVEGRRKNSNGSNCLFLAEKLEKMGAVQAMNLDGGQTSAMMFMGEKVNRMGKVGESYKARNISGMIAAGKSPQVPD